MTLYNNYYTGRTVRLTLRLRKVYSGMVPGSHTADPGRAQGIVVDGIDPLNNALPLHFARGVSDREEATTAYGIESPVASSPLRPGTE